MKIEKLKKSELQELAARELANREKSAERARRLRAKRAAEGQVTIAVSVPRDRADYIRWAIKQILDMDPATYAKKAKLAGYD